MHIRVLGSSAGGGFPQWNCHCRNCSNVRAGKPGLRPRTQSSLAVSADGKQWVLLNASPDLRQQINDAPALSGSANGTLRDSPIKAAVLTNADVDHIAGLINLREMQPLTVYGTDRVLTTLKANSVFNVLSADLVPRIELPLGTPIALGSAGKPIGLEIEAFAVPGKVALYLEDAAAGPNLGTTAGDTIALKVTSPATGRYFIYMPACARVDADVAQRVEGAPLIFFDGTLYTDDEMLQQGLMPKTGNRMGHISISGPNGSIAAFEKLGVARKIFVHINNSNPVLDETSPEHAAARAAGWEIGYDGLEVRL